MTDRAEQKLDRLREQIETSDALTDCDRENLLAFSERLFVLQSQYSVARHYKLLQHCTIMAGQSQRISDEELPDIELSAILDSRADCEGLVAWINRRYDNEETNADMRIALRVFAKHVTDGEEVPTPVEWVPTGTSRNYDPAPDPSDMLSWDEAQTLADNTLNARDAALVTVGWDAGCRGGEMRSLSVGDVTDHQHGLQITVRGKTGQRSITLIPAVPYLQQWLGDHPDRSDPEAPLWSKLSTAESVSQETLWKALKRAGERAGISKPVNFTNLRKSSASHLASQGMNQAHLEDHHGWSRGSDVASRYVAVFGDEADNELARIHGKEVEQDGTERLAPIPCPRCGKDTPRDEEFCVWCDQAIDRGAVQSLREDTEEVQRRVLQLAREDPDLLDDVEKRQAVISKLEQDPELLDRALDFVEEVD